MGIVVAGSIISEILYLLRQRWRTAGSPCPAAESSCSAPMRARWTIEQLEGSVPLEVVWSVIPLVIGELGPRREPGLDQRLDRRRFGQRLLPAAPMLGSRRLL